MQKAEQFYKPLAAEEQAPEEESTLSISWASLLSLRPPIKLTEE